jgi:hypothetical protein
MFRPKNQKGLNDAVWVGTCGGASMSVAYRFEIRLLIPVVIEDDSTDPINMALANGVKL